MFNAEKDKSICGDGECTCQILKIINGYGSIDKIPPSVLRNIAIKYCSKSILSNVVNHFPQTSSKNTSIISGSSKITKPSLTHTENLKQGLGELEKCEQTVTKNKDISLELHPNERNNSTRVTSDCQSELNSCLKSPSIIIDKKKSDIYDCKNHSTFQLYPKTNAHMQNERLDTITTEMSQLPDALSNLTALEKLSPTKDIGVSCEPKTSVQNTSSLIQGTTEISIRDLFTKNHSVEHKVTSLEIHPSGTALSFYSTVKDDAINSISLQSSTSLEDSSLHIGDKHSFPAVSFVSEIEIEQISGSGEQNFVGSKQKIVSELGNLDTILLTSNGDDIVKIDVSHPFSPSKKSNESSLSKNSKNGLVEDQNLILGFDSTRANVNESLSSCQTKNFQLEEKSTLNIFNQKFDHSQSNSEMNEVNDRSPRTQFFSPDITSNTQRDKFSSNEKFERQNSFTHDLPLDAKVDLARGSSTRSSHQRQSAYPNCTLCKSCVRSDPCEHPVLSVLICVKCEKKIYGIRRHQTSIPVGDYCSWCFFGGELVCCDSCSLSFCKSCISKNLGPVYLQKILSSSSEWQCFKCDQPSILELVRICYKLLNKDIEAFEKNLHQSKSKKLNAYPKLTTQKRKRIVTASSDESDVSDSSSSNGEGMISLNLPQNSNRLLKISPDVSSTDSERIEFDTLPKLKTSKAKKIKKNEQPSKIVTMKVESQSIILETSANGQPIISLSAFISSKLKPHQIEGVKFMYDRIVKNVEHFKATPKSYGEGCLIAQCMGLGKTIQVVALLGALFNFSLIKTCLILCPYNACEHWLNEFNDWMPSNSIPIHKLIGTQKINDRESIVDCWFNKGGIIILSYSLYRSLLHSSPKYSEGFIHKMKISLLDPGPDIIVCDEGHFIKNHKSALYESLSQINTRRRIILTGTPLQNHLTEYFVMIDFVQPGLLSDRKTFETRFKTPIENGQLADASPFDVKYMNKRCHILNDIIKPVVNRQDHTVLIPYLPAKNEYTIYIRSSPLQETLFNYFLKQNEIVNNLCMQNSYIFQAFQDFILVGSHPAALILRERRRSNDMEEDFDEGMENEKTNPIDITGFDQPLPKKNPKIDRWYRNFVDDEKLLDIKLSGKMVVLNSIICDTIAKNDKIAIFSQSLSCLDLIQLYLIEGIIKPPSKKDGHWKLNQHFFRIDGSTFISHRTEYIQKFNNPQNKEAIIMLLSTRSGGTAINLHGANRIVLMDCSWNPSNDVQALFRVYRLGQDKRVIIYRLISQGVLEECVYNLQILKLGLSSRVVDKKQIDRVFNQKDISQFIRVNIQPINYSNPSMYKSHDFSKDPGLESIINECFPLHIVKYINHDSLLTDDPTQNLSEEEKLQALKEYQFETTEIRAASSTPIVYPQQIPK